VFDCILLIFYNSIEHSGMSHLKVIICQPEMGTESTKCLMFF